MITCGTQVLFGAPLAGGINPMTAAADIIVGGTAGAMTRLAKGSALQVLKVNAGATALEWAADASGFANPMTTRGDLIRGGVAGAAERVAAVTNGHVVGGDGTDVVSRAIATTLAVDAAANRTAIGAGTSSVAVGTGSGNAYDGARGAQLATMPVYIPLVGTVFTVAALAGGGFPAGINAIGGTPVAVDPATYARTGLTAAFTLCLTGYTDNASRTGTCTLWDLTTDAAVATATFNNAGPTAAAATGVATLNATPHVYEVRLSVSGTLDTHLATVNNASLRITWS